MRCEQTSSRYEATDDILFCDNRIFNTVRDRIFNNLGTTTLLLRPHMRKHPIGLHGTPYLVLNYKSPVSAGEERRVKNEDEIAESHRSQLKFYSEVYLLSYTKN